MNALPPSPAGSPDGTPPCSSRGSRSPAFRSSDSRRCCAAAACLFSEARRWLGYVEAHLPPDYAAQKALDALALSFRCAGGCPRDRSSGCASGCGASGGDALRIPTKLVGVAAPERQAALRALPSEYRSGHPLSLARDSATGRVYAYGVGPLGYVQRMHGWLGPLVGLARFAEAGRQLAATRISAGRLREICLGAIPNLPVSTWGRLLDRFVEHEALVEHVLGEGFRRN